MDSSALLPTAPPCCLETLPCDCAAGVLSCLAITDVCSMACTSRSLRATCSDAIVWEHMAIARGMILRCDRRSFRSAWDSAMQAVALVPHLTETFAAQDQCTPTVSMLSASSPVVCSSPLSTVSVARSSYWTGISGEQFIDGVRAFQASFRAADTTRLHPMHLVDWLHTPAAHSEPLRCLAILAALQDEKKWRPVLDSSSSSASCAYPEQGPDRAREPPAVEAVRRLLDDQAFSRTPATIWIKWHTWSNLRDCRGFRARDDVHRRTAGLQELACQADHVIWRILARGITQEVRDLRVGVNGA